MPARRSPFTNRRCEGQRELAGAGREHVGLRVERRRLGAAAELQRHRRWLEPPGLAVHDAGVGEARPADAAAVEGELLERRGGGGAQQEPESGGGEHGRRGKGAEEHAAPPRGQRRERVRARRRLRELLQVEGEVARRLEAFLAVLLEAAPHGGGRGGRRSKGSGPGRRAARRGARAFIVSTAVGRWNARAPVSIS